MAEESNPWLPSFEEKNTAPKKKFTRYFDASESAPDNSGEAEQNKEFTEGRSGPRAGRDYSSQSGRNRGNNSRGAYRGQNNASRRGREHISHRGNAPNITENRFPGENSEEHSESHNPAKNQPSGANRSRGQSSGNRRGGRQHRGNNRLGGAEKWKGQKVFTPDLEAVTMRAEKFAGPAPVDPKKLERYSYGTGPDTGNISTAFHATMLNKREKLIKASVEQAARAEVLLTENEGYLEADEGESTYHITQKQLVAAVDITTATKHFDLHLDTFGPYRVNYNRSGRFLLIGGRKGHIAAMNWQSKRLMCEMNVMEEVFDVQWLHVETMFAVAQKNSVCIYDNLGIELHCLKKLNRVLRMEFLPYHFMLACSSEAGRISWLDISRGEIVASHRTRTGRLGVMTQNPANAVICVGQTRGIVSMWSPTTTRPLAKVLVHSHPVQAIAIDHCGRYMATSCLNRTVRIWDLRNLGDHVAEYRLRSAATNISISQTGLMALSLGNGVEVYRNCLRDAGDCTEEPYLRQRFSWPVENMQFCPLEDVLGVGYVKGFTSLIVPGAGEANFDGLEVNPYQSKAYRREAEVKALLGKIQPEFITLDPQRISVVNVAAVRKRLEKEAETQIFERPTLDMKHRKNVKGGATMISKVKKKLTEAARMKFVKIKAAKKAKNTSQEKLPTPSAEESVLDRFVKKPKGSKKVVKKPKVSHGKVSKNRSKKIFIN